MHDHHRMHRMITLASAAAIGMLGAPRPAHPAVKSWTLNGVGLYFHPFNWSGNTVPNSSDSVVLSNLNGQVVFTNGADVENKWMRVEDASFSLNLVGTTYSLWGDNGYFTDGMSLQVAREANSSATLVVENGTIDGVKAIFGDLAGSAAWCQVESDATLLMSDVVQIGRHGYGGLAIIGGTASVEGVSAGSGSGTGDLFVTSGASMTTGGTVSVLGGQGTGRLYLHTGGDLSFQSSVVFGSAATGYGWAAIRDAGTTFDAGNAITLGSSGSALFKVEDGADVEAHQMIMAKNAGSSGELKIEGAGSTVSLDDQLEVGSGGTIDVIDGGELNVEGATTIDFGGSVQLDAATFRTGQLYGDGDFYWNAGSRLEVTGGDLNVGEDGTASDLVVWSRELEVSDDLRAYDDGTYAVVSVKNGNASVGDNAFFGTVTDMLGRLDVEQNGYATIGGTLYLGGTAQPRGTAILNLEDGGILSVGEVVRVWDGSSINMDAQSNLWCGELDVAGGTVGADGDLNVIKGETLLLVSGNSMRVSGFGETATALVRDGGSLETAAGDIATYFDADATVEVRGAGSSWISAGNITIGRADGAADQGTLTVADGGRVESATALTIYTDGGLVLDGGDVEAPNVQNGGRIVGEGNIHGDVVNDALIAPGSSPGLIRIVGGGSYTQSADGTLDIELAGTQPIEHDRLAVYGDVQLAGTLRISVIDDYEPAVGDTFQIITAVEITGGEVIGTFDAVTPSALYDVIYEDHQVLVEVISVCAADVNGSGHVGFDDLIELLNNWGPCPAPCVGDLDDSGHVGFDDMQTLLQAWGVCG